MGGFVNSFMKLAALFPGQGSQFAGMNRVLLDNFSFTTHVYEEASEAIKVDLKKLCLDGPDSELQLTANAQPAILTTSYAWFSVLKKALDFAPAVGAGHSLGEYSALTSSGAVSLADAVKLVRKRGELMQTAVPPGKGKMAAVLGLADEVILEICKAASEGETSLVVPANFNAPSQVVVAGHAGAVERFEKLASNPEKKEWKARKVIPLNVSAPFHCPLMKKVAQDFEPYLKATKWNAPTFPVVSNLDGQIRKEGDLVPVLRDQIDHSVLWTKCIKAIESNGQSVFIEMGPGKVLTGLVKRIATEPKLFNLETIEDFKNLEKAYQENFK